MGLGRSWQRGRQGLLSATTRLATSRPWAVLSAALLLAVVSVAYTWSELELWTDRNDLISSDWDWNRRFERYRERFEHLSDVLVVLTEAPLDRRKALADRIAAALEDEPSVDEVLYRVDPEPLRASALLHLDEAELADLRTTLEDHRELLTDLLEDPGLVPLLEAMDREVGRAMVTSLVSGLFAEKREEEPPAAPLDLSLLIDVLADVRERLVDPSPPYDYRANWSSLLAGGRADTDGYFVSDDARFLFVLISPAEAGSRGDAGDTVSVVRRTLSRLAEDFPEVEYGVTGQRVLSADEMATSARDTLRASWIALLGVALVFVLGFRCVRHPVLAVVSLAVGLCWAAGATTLLVGHLTVLSVAFATILIGLGIDFGIHLVARFEEERRRGGGVSAAIARAVAGSGPGILAGALTTALAFYALLATDFQGIAELGIIAGTGVLLCLAATLLVLPALLVRFPGCPLPPRRPEAPDAPLERAYRRPRLLVALSLALAGVGLALAPGVGFDGNMLSLQAEGLESVAWEQRLLREAGRSSWFAASIVDSGDREEVIRRAAAFEQLPEVSDVQTIVDLVPPDQAERSRRARALAPLVEPLPTEERPSAAVRLDALTDVVERLRFKIREDRKGGPNRPPPWQLARAREALAAVHAALADPELRREPAVERLNAYQRRLMEDLRSRLRLLKAAVHPEPIAMDDLPAPLVERYRGKDGALLIRVFPEGDIWDDERRARFVDAVRTVDPEITGGPVQVHEASGLMLRGYVQGGLYALAVVLVLLLLDLRSLRWSLFAMLPLLVGALWTLGFMRLTGLSFNLANLVILPLLLGIGIDTGIHLVHRFRADGLTGAPLVRSSTGRAVVLSALTTAVGFGSLIVAEHRGIHSIGAVLAAGVLLTLVAALTVLVPALKWVARRRGPAGTQPPTGEPAQTQPLPEEGP